MKKALIIYGGWEGHDPVGVAKVFTDTLKTSDFEVKVSDTLDSLLDTEQLKTYHLIIPIWTMGEITDKQMESISTAVACGVGLAGCHGGMCDAFRENVDWQFMTGGNWVSHPGGDQVEYEVNIKNSSSRIVEGIVGCGNISDIYLKNCTEIFDNLQVVGCADLIRERAEEKAKQYNVKAYSVDELIKFNNT